MENFNVFVLFTIFAAFVVIAAYLVIRLIDHVFITMEHEQRHKYVMEDISHLIDSTQTMSIETMKKINQNILDMAGEDF